MRSSWTASGGTYDSLSPVHTTSTKKRALGLGRATPQGRAPSSSLGSVPRALPTLFVAEKTPSPGGDNAYPGHLESILGTSPIPSPGLVPGRNSRSLPNREGASSEVARMNFEQKESPARGHGLLPLQPKEIKKRLYVKRVEVGEDAQQQQQQRRSRRRAVAATRHASAPQTHMQSRPSLTLRSPTFLETPTSQNRVTISKTDHMDTDLSSEMSDDVHHADTPEGCEPEGAFVLQQVGRRTLADNLRAVQRANETQPTTPDALAEEALREMFFMDAQGGQPAGARIAEETSTQRGGSTTTRTTDPTNTPQGDAADTHDKTRYRESLRSVFFTSTLSSQISGGGVLLPQINVKATLETKEETRFRRNLKTAVSGAKPYEGVSTVVPSVQKAVVPLGVAQQADRSFLYAGAEGAKKKKRTARALPQVADRVLDAPCVVDDFLLSTIDWSGWANVMSVCLNDTIYTWDAASGVSSELLSLEDDMNAVTSVKWIQEGLVLAFGCSANGAVRVWDVTQGRQLRQMSGHSDRICSLAWNEHILTTGSRDGTICHHDVRVKKHVISKLQLMPHPTYSSEVCNIQYSPDFSALAASNTEGVVSVFDASPNAANKPISTMKLHNGPVKALSWAPDKRHHLVTGGYGDRMLKMTKVSGVPETISSIKTEGSIVSCLWSKHSSELVTCGGAPTNAVTVYSQTKQSTFKKVGDIRAHKYVLGGVVWVVRYAGIFMKVFGGREGGVFALSVWLCSIFNKKKYRKSVVLQMGKTTLSKKKK